jgi:hypothetical protein
MRGVSTGRKVSCRLWAEHSSVRTVRSPSWTYQALQSRLPTKAQTRATGVRSPTEAWGILSCVQQSRSVSFQFWLSLTLICLLSLPAHIYNKNSHLLYSWPFEVPPSIPCWSLFANTPPRARCNGRADFKIPDQMSLIE